jgi:aminopeptidase N
VNPSFVAKRSLKNTCLRYLGRLNTKETQSLIADQYYRADNMTDRFAALQAINHVEGSLRDELLADFAIAWKHEPLVLDKWFALQAASELPNTALKVKELLGHPEFLLENPNKLYALLGTFSQLNPYHFHDISGNGYKLFADEILRIEKFNPQVAARLANAFSRWRRYDEQRQKLLKYELDRILNTQGLSADVYEIISKCLA